MKLAAGKSGRVETTFFALPAVRRALTSLSRGPIAIVVGAGASAEAGFPTWGTLLNQVLDSKAEGMRLPSGPSGRLLQERISEEPDLPRRADLVAQLFATRKQFIDALTSALYSSAELSDRPGPTARAVARLYMAENPKFLDQQRAPCLLATTNFDLMLEIALREQRVAMVREEADKRNETPVPTPMRWAISHQGGDFAEPLAPRVRHLHGHLAGAHRPYLRRGGNPNQVVITGTDFLSKQNLWHIDFLNKIMSSHHLLFVGASLNDTHLLTSLLERKTSSQRSIVALVPRRPTTGQDFDLWQGHDPAALHLEETQARVFERHYGTKVLAPDWYLQVGQFVEELIAVRHAAKAAASAARASAKAGAAKTTVAAVKPSTPSRPAYPPGYKPYERRLADWFKWFSTNKVFLPSDRVSIEDFRANQVGLNAILRQFIGGRSVPSGIPGTEDIEEAARAGAPDGVLDWIAKQVGESSPGEWARETGECLAVHLWTRIPNHQDPSARRHRELAMTAASDRIWQHPGAVDSRRITYPTRRTAIEAFVTGFMVTRNTADRDHQWNFVAALPVRLKDRPGIPPMTVAVISLQSSLPWSYQKPDGRLRPPLSGDPLVADAAGRLTPYESLGKANAPVSMLRLAHETWVAAGGHGKEPLDLYLGRLARSARQLADPVPGSGN